MALSEPFEQHSERYDQWFEEHSAVYQAELEAVRSLLPAQGEGVEIGVGSGRFAAPLGITSGVEPSSAMAHQAEERGIRVIAGEAEQLPLDNQSYDYTLFVTTICFLSDMERAFTEAHRITRAGGCILIGFVDRESPLGRQYQKKKEHHPFYHVATFYSVPEVLAVLDRAGYGNYSFAQTVFHGLGNQEAPEPVREGYGEGSFVVIRGERL